MSINKVTLIGNLGKDPEVRYMPNGDAVANFSLATSETWKDKQTGERKEKTEWHKVVVFGKLAEIAGEFVRKGSKLYIEGKLQTRKWQGQDGQDKYTTEVVLQGFGCVLEMLNKVEAQHQGAIAQQQQPPMQQQPQQQAAPQYQQPQQSALQQQAPQYQQAPQPQQYNGG